MLHPRLSVLSAVALFTLGACFSPALPDHVACGASGSCPPTFRCETSTNVCVPIDQAAVTELAFTRQPETVEATVDAPAVVLELRNAAGEKVPLSGGTFAVELLSGDAEVNLNGSSIAAADGGVVSFAELRYDRPARGVRLRVHGGDIVSTSEPFDVTTTRPAVLGIGTSGIVDGCGTIRYQLQQAQSLPVDVLVEFDPDGPDGPLPFRRATQAASEPGRSGIAGISGSPQGRGRTFSWNTSADLPATDATVELRITPSLGGLVGKELSAPITVENGPRFVPVPTGSAAYGAVHLLDADRDGRRSLCGLDATSHHLVLEGLEDLPIAESESVRDFDLGDFDGDGLPDVAVSTGGRTFVAYQERAPRGSWSAAFDVGPSFAQLLAPDLDRDGLADLVGVEATTGDVVLLRSSRGIRGSFGEVARPWRGGGTGTVRVADLDRDGRPDLIVGRASASQPIAVIRGNLLGLTAPTLDSGLVGDDLDVADLDLDGRDDLASLDASGLHVVTAAGRVDVAGVAGGAFTLHDMNGDTLPDVVVAGPDSVYFYPHVASRHLVAFGARAPVGAAAGVSRLFVDTTRAGRADVATIGPDQVTWFFGSMPGRCDARLDGPVLSSASSFEPHGVFADVDGDGKVDYVSETGGFSEHRKLVAMLGQGDGSFVLRGDSLFETREGSSVRDLTATDLDADGAVDLAFADPDAHAVTIAYNDAVAPGTFLGSDLTMPLPQALAVADVDHDQTKDLVLLESGRVQIRRGVGGGKRGFADPVVLPSIVDTTGELGLCRYACELSVLDFDGDGDLDILVTTTDGLHYFAADAAAPLGYHDPVKLPWTSFYLAEDLVGDPRPELLVAEPADGQGTHLAAYQMGPGGVFEKTWEAPDVSPVAPVMTTDLDGDGKKELLLAAADQPLALLRTDAGARPTPLSPAFFATPNDVFTRVDVDADGQPDLVIVSFGDLTTIRMGAHGPDRLGTLLTPRGEGDPGGYGNGLALGDFSGDGLPDLAVRDAANQRFTLLEQSTDTPGTLLPGEHTVPGSYFAALADLDGDRRADLLTYGADASLVFLDPTSDAPAGLCHADFNGFPLVVADLDGDGRNDVIESSWTDLLLLRSPADSCAAPVSIMSLDRPGVPHWHPLEVQVADLDRDGLLDVIVATNALRVAHQRPDAPGTFTVTDYETVNDPDRRPYLDFAVADVDNDGDLDVAVIDGNYAIRIFANDSIPVGTLVPSVVVPGSASYSSRQSISVGDVDGDGSPDLVIGGPGVTDVFRQTLTGAVDGGQFELAYRTLGPRGYDWDSDRVTVVDFDSDGRNDVLFVDPAQGTMLLRGR